MYHRFGRRRPIVVHPEDFGAVGDGSTDDTTAIENAYASLSGVGGTVQFQDRPYLCRRQIAVPRLVHTRGYANMVDMSAYNPSPVTTFGTVLLSDQTGAFSFLKLSDGCTVRDINFDATADSILPTAGAVIDFSGAYGVSITDVHINRSFVGILATAEWQTPLTFNIERVAIRNFVSEGISLRYAVWGYINNVFIMNVAGSPLHYTGCAIRMTGGCESLNLLNLLLEETLDGIRLEGDAHELSSVCPHFIRMDNVQIDRPDRTGFAVIDTFHTTIHDCIVGGGKVDVYIAGASSDIEVSGLQTWYNREHPIWIAESTVKNVNIHDNKISLPIYGISGITVAANTSYFAVHDNQMHLTDPGGGSEAVGSADYLVTVASGTSDHYTIVNNIGAGASGVVSDGGSGENKTVTGNIS